MQLSHRRLTERYPLRITIVVVLLALVIAALLASGVVATTIMRGYLSTASTPAPAGGAPTGRLSAKPRGRRRGLPGGGGTCAAHAELVLVQYNDADGGVGDSLDRVAPSPSRSRLPTC